ncbi:MAG: hypothetical protein DIU77_017845, partial [Thermocrispum agreste]
MTRPTVTDTKDNIAKVREQVNSAFEQVRTPLLAALGAGNLATKAVVDTVHKARERAGEGREGVRKTIDEAGEGLRKAIDEARKAAEDLRGSGDFSELRSKLTADELRKLVDEYSESARKLYDKLAEAGEEAWDQLLAQPQVRNTLEQLQ